MKVKGNAKLNNGTNKPANIKKNKSPKKQGKGVGVRTEKSKEVVKPVVLKNEAKKIKTETPPSPQKLLQQELWKKAIENVSVMSDLSAEENSIAKLLADYKKKSSIPQKSAKLKNFIVKGFSKFKDTTDEVLDGVYNKLINEFKAVGGNVNSVSTESKKSNPKTAKPKSKKDTSNDEEMDLEDGDDDDVDDDDEDVIDDEDDIDDEDIEFDDSDDEEEIPKPKAKGNKPNNKNGKSEPIKGKNGSKFKGGKVQKNKQFGKKKSKFSSL